MKTEIEFFKKKKTNKFKKIYKNERKIEINTQTLKNKTA